MPALAPIDQAHTWRRTSFPYDPEWFVWVREDGAAPNDRLKASLKRANAELVAW
jgi:hypothetical protein